MLNSIRQDMLYTFRSFSRTPGLAAAIVVSIGLGIAANTTVFSLINELLIRDVPVREPAGLFALARGRSFTFSYPDYRDFRDASGIWDGLAAHCPLAPANINAGGTPERIWGQLVSGNYFPIVSSGIYLGRGIQPFEDEVPGRNPVVVLGYGLWRRLGSNPAIVGSSIHLNGAPYTVVGVSVPGFFGTDRGLGPEFWAPLAMRRHLWPDLSPQHETQRTHHFLEFTGRLKPGVSREQAVAALNVIAARSDSQQDRQSRARRTEPVTLNRAGHFPDIGPVVNMLMSALAVVVGLVLLIACANVANLLVARAASREREIGIRLAIGASRGRLVRQLLTESILLSGAGAAFGFLLSMPGTSALARFQAPIPVPLRFDFSPDARVLAFTTVLAVLTGLIFGLAPALTGARGSVAVAVRGGAFGSGGPRRGRLAGVLVGVQVTLSLVLLAASGLFLRSLQHASAIDLGMRPEGVLMLSVDTRTQGYSVEKTKQFFRALEERVSRLAGVQSVSYSHIAPLSMSSSERDYENAEAAASKQVSANLFLVGASYFDTMGIPLVRGRDFSRQRDDNLPVALINRTMAARLFGGEDPVGRRVREGRGGSAAAYEVIGVVGDSKAAQLGEETRPCIYRYLPSDFGQVISLLGATIVVRTGGDPGRMAPAIRREIETIDSNLAVFNLETMTEHVDKAMMLPRVCATLFGLFGVVGLVLASVGLYGVVNYSVRTRTREIGIRMALGARPTRVALLVARQGLAVVVSGLAVGMAIALSLSRYTASLLYGIQPTDAVTFAGVPALLAVVALVAILVPARRASRLHPIEALREE